MYFRQPYISQWFKVKTYYGWSWTIVGRYFKLLLLLLLCLLKSNNTDISLLYYHHHRWPGTVPHYTMVPSVHLPVPFWHKTSEWKVIQTINVQKTAVNGRHAESSTFKTPKKIMNGDITFTAARQYQSASIKIPFLPVCPSLTLCFLEQLSHLPYSFLALA